MPKTSKQKGRVVLCKVSMEMFVEIEKIAKEEYWNLSGVVREAIKYYLKNKGKKSIEDDK